ncbi:disintegrin and metalloproteinase domain-containing protein 18 isoform X6 [Canis lupus familiaris]|uniref:disintegrin and metalloproteinase domain-containing protein 18 isoform X6 n=1 Tax=Canis lupus familiaris TaxID=9615 RepID=UPI000BAA340D|nr:disintegrin and metalloproteinase domain-containing protein 18 isoform X6 [Canis lupus familiaris]XP_038415918.1 disintegrin and metalloproteinase domain-containing protein 18 isoform X6 [Canis lupus familiaris]|eukprot:XP_022259718.1 disintegrin and metalloproteinase domain-containing protein 18 isoform X6 [Canis lupus familiaris]
MFLLFALLSELGRLHARLDSEGILLHVTVPWKIRSNESENSEKQVIYIITIDEKPYTLHLRKHSFLSHNFLVYAYNETGFLHSESSYFKMHCHYQGYVADIPNSLATLSICSGLRGFLQFGNITFGIEPLESSASFEHIIYQVKNDDPDIPLLAENYSNSWQKNQPYKDNLSSQEPTLSELLPQYLEIHITVEKGLYDYMGSEMMAVTQKIIQIIGLVNTYSDAITLEGFSVIIAQLLGLKMGLTYDDINTCSCPRATCIMDRKAVGSSGIKFFSNCSMHDYRYFVSKFETKCLQNFPNLQPLYQNQSVCGNGILEPNEECDCGSQEECQFKKCCDFNTCKLKGSAKCGSGPCCTSNCEISVAGTPCRKIIDQECDFTEYCNGTSSNCVPDTYASNGMLCRLGTAYCYNGRCQTTDNQCAQIFGEGAQGAPFACFKEINSLHDKFGNCGFKNSQPLPCDQKDVLCGKLACVWPHKNTYKNDVRSAVYSYIQGHACISMTTGLSVRSDGRDYAYVADGTVCGAQMYCINKTCRKVHLMGYNCNAIAKCRGNGICNNLGNCHCFPGYRPPYCEFQIGSPGGSIDDGNVKKSDIIFIKEDYNAQQNNWLILSFYIVLPFIIIFTIMIIKRNEMRKSCKRENAEYEGERERGRDTGKEKSKCQAGNLTWNSILGPGSPWTPGCRLHQTAVPPGLPENLQCLDVVLKLSLIPGTSKCLSLVVSNTVKKVSSEFL